MNAPQRKFEAKKWRHLPVPAPHTYAISNSGDVCRLDSGRLLKPCKQKRGGYLAVSLWTGNKGKLCPVHQLVAFGFHGPRPSPRHHAAHMDGDKLHNTPDNVQWCTKEENEAHKKLHGTDNAGERNGSAKLTADQVREIRSAHASGATTAELKRRFKLEQSHLWSIIHRRLWRHI